MLAKSFQAPTSWPILPRTRPTATHARHSHHPDTHTRSYHLFKHIPCANLTIYTTTPLLTLQTSKKTTPFHTIPASHSRSFLHFQEDSTWSQQSPALLCSSSFQRREELGKDCRVSRGGSAAFPELSGVSNLESLELVEAVVVEMVEVVVVVVVVELWQ